MCLHNKVITVHRDYDFIHTDGSVLNVKAAVHSHTYWEFILIERFPERSSTFLAELHALYLTLDRLEMADDDEKNFIIFSDSKSSLSAIGGQDWTHPYVLKALQCLHWLVQYHAKTYYFTEFQVMLEFEVMRRHVLWQKLAHWKSYEYNHSIWWF